MHGYPLAVPKFVPLQALSRVVSAAAGFIPMTATHDSESANRAADPNQVVVLAKTRQLNRHRLPDGHGECLGP